MCGHFFESSLFLVNLAKSKKRVVEAHGLNRTNHVHSEPHPSKQRRNTMDHVTEERPYYIINYCLRQTTEGSSNKTRIRMIVLSLDISRGSPRI
jgi:hypothetical protein